MSVLLLVAVLKCFCCVWGCSGEFTLWQGDTFKFERIVSVSAASGQVHFLRRIHLLTCAHAPVFITECTQTHDDAVRALAWSASGNMLISGDAKGNIKYFAVSIQPFDRVVLWMRNAVETRLPVFALCLVPEHHGVPAKH